MKTKILADFQICISVPLSKALAELKLSFEGQFGFRNNRSTTDALIDITERIRDACDLFFLFIYLFIYLICYLQSIKKTVLRLIYIN